MQENTLVKFSVKNILNTAIALVWLINGLFCKLLNFVPRHQIIVARILGENYSFIETRVIGVLEILMFIWIISKIKPRLCVFVQVIIIATMNIIEFILVPDLLLFGRVNIILAAILILIILFNEFWIYDNGKNN